MTPKHENIGKTMRFRDNPGVEVEGEIIEYHANTASYIVEWTDGYGLSRVPVDSPDIISID